MAEIDRDGESESRIRERIGKKERILYKHQHPNDGHGRKYCNVLRDGESKDSETERI
jgi:hypothetical protein